MRQWEVEVLRCSAHQCSRLVYSSFCGRCSEVFIGVRKYAGVRRCSLVFGGVFGFVSLFLRVSTSFSSHDEVHIIINIHN